VVYEWWDGVAVCMERWVVGGGWSGVSMCGCLVRGGRGRIICSAIRIYQKAKISSWTLLKV